VPKTAITDNHLNAAQALMKRGFRLKAISRNDPTIACPNAVPARTEFVQNGYKSGLPRGGVGMFATDHCAEPDLSSIRHRTAQNV
jgi:hypothetical protein